MLKFDTNVQFLKGVGPRLSALLSRHGVSTISDLLEFYPRTYEDRRVARNITSLQADETVSLRAHILNVRSFAMGASKRKIYEVLLGDGSGKIACKFFRVPYKGYFERFRPHMQIRVVGKVTNYRGRLEFHHPDLRDISEEEESQNEKDQLMPIYTEIEGLSTSKIYAMIMAAFKQLEDLEVEDKLPGVILQKYKLLSRWQALQKIHRPDVQLAKDYLEQKSEAHRRIIFEEFFWLELYLAAQKTGFKKVFTRSHKNDSPVLSNLIKSLPFELTGAQLRSFAEIKEDLDSEHPMHRLVQGDVGSGKTMIAWLAACYVWAADGQTCMMVPTEILAEQHFKNALKLLEPLGMKIAMLTGKTKTAERKVILEDLAAGKTNLIVGTHALIEDWVQFKALSLVIIDEQHRFGVQQRGLLKEKGQNPHFLVMTATPIPRTLAMTVYGDLDVSVIDELPPGRSPIQTRVVYESKKEQVLSFMQEQVLKGRQAYIVYPLVEESEKIDLKNAVDEFEKLGSKFPQIKFGLLHGKMKADEKDAVMVRFRTGEIQVLVSTTVIEVGVDVPNANLMIIEHSERFGLSQLHQLRGRVGRGQHKSFCILVMGYAVSEESRERTAVMEKTTDGFKIAEFDLEFRGPGEFLGTKQSGLPGFRLANLVRDVVILQEARQAAFDTLREDPLLQKSSNKSLREELLRAHGPAALASIG